MVITSALMALVVVAILTTGRSGGPSYAGRSADEWLRRLIHPAAGADPEGEFKSALSAFEQMGTNATSFLVETMQRQDSQFSSFYARLRTALPKGIGNQIPKPTLASMKASWAVTLLTRMDDPQPETTFRRLASALSTSNPGVRVIIAGAMSEYVKKYPKLDVIFHRPVIVATVGDTNADFPNLLAKRLLVETLHKAGLEGPELRPTFQPLLTNSDPWVRRLAQDALIKLQATNLPALTDAP
jgi:hypothetical protein